MISKILVINQDHQQDQHQDAARQYLLGQNLIESNQPNFHLNWINSEEDSLKIKQVRQLIEQTSYQAYDEQPQIYVLLKADTASTPAQNALLKIIEEPPEQTQIILTVSQPDKLLPTIRSRCLIESIDASPPEVKLEEKLSKEKKSGSQLEPLIDQILTALTNPKKISYSQIINWAGQLKNREQAIKLVKNLIDFLYNKEVAGKKLTKELTKKLTIAQPIRIKALTSLVEAYNNLEKNANVKLTIESCFFSLK